MAKIFSVRIFQLAVILAMVIPLVVSSGQAQKLAPEGDRPLLGLVRGAEFSSLSLPMDTYLYSQPAEASPAAVSSLITPSKLVFSSYRDWNYEIYLSNDDGSDLQRLTNNSETDIQPRINKAFTRIVFATYRNGNYEIYTMNLDGSGLARLTNTPTDDVNPAWSPDGAKIAFESYRDGHAEVYVMNADGSGLTRLTYSTDFAGEPSWSPDGSWIAFTAYRNGQWRIWVMQADGSGQVQLSQEPYSAKAAWSRDGGMIAYSADGNGDGWNELWKMNADGSGRTANPNTALVEWNFMPQSWSPDRVWIVVCMTHWILYNGQWYWDRAQFLGYKPSFGPGDVMYFAGYGMDWDPDWETPDITAPGSSMQSLPALSPGPFEVIWNGTDPGGVGIGGYQVQVKEGDAGSWVDWKPDTQETFGVYPGVGGHTYSFRVRARDQVYNQEPFRPGADATTTVEALPPVTTMQALPAQSPGPFTVKWSGNDPGGSGIASYTVQVKDGLAGIWTDWKTGMDTSGSYPGLGGHSYYFRVRAVDGAQNQEAFRLDYDIITTVEALPPITQLKPLPKYLLMPNGGPISVSWSGGDPGYSGIKAYDVQYRHLPGGSWTDWQMNTQDTSAVYNAALGEALAFRARAIDNALNQEPWHGEDQEVSTAVCNFQLGGTVTDNTGVPIAGVSATVDPIPFFSSLSQLDGSYDACSASGTSEVTVNWQKNGYGSLPATIVRALGTGVLNPVLPPGDNVVVNPGLEFDSAVESPWVPSGMDEPFVNANAYTGKSSAILGEALSLVSAANITNDRGYAPARVAAADSEGNINLIFERGTVYYARKENQAGWSTPIPISHDVWITETSGAPGLAVGPDGTVHVIWMGMVYPDYELLYWQRGPDGMMSDQQVITLLGNLKHDVKMVVDKFGTLHIAWVDQSDSWGKDGPVLYMSRTSAGVWSAPLPLSEISDGNRSCLVLAVDGNGTVHLAWCSGLNILYRQRSPGGSWSPTEGVATFIDRWGSPLSLDMKVDASGQVYLIHDTTAGKPWSIGFMRRSLPGIWTADAIISNPKVNAYMPLMAQDSDGSIHAAWKTMTPANGSAVTYRRLPSGGSWLPEEQVSNPDHSTNDLVMVVDKAGIVHMGWAEAFSYYDWRLGYAVRTDGWAVTAGEFAGSPLVVLDGDQKPHIIGVDVDVFEYVPNLMADAFDSVLSQTVALSVPLSNPVLSFVYQTVGLSAAAGTDFKVDVLDRKTTTNLLTTSASTSGWSHRWFDLRPWAGEEITLTFTVQLAKDEVPGFALVDDVTVGSAAPDVWIHAAALPVAAMPGDTLQVELTYDNRGFAPAVGASVTFTLPDGLTFDSADLPPSSIVGQVLTWDIGDLAGRSGPFTVHLTATVDADAAILTTLTGTAQILTSSIESEILNNTFQTSIFIGTKTFVPVVNR